MHQRTDDLSEALEQQTATSEVLKVISSSPGELDPVFQAMLANAVRICDAKFGVMFRYNNEIFTPAAFFDAPEALADVERIVAIWNGCRRRYASGGPFLFGHFTIADAMYAPIPLRFQTWGVSVEGLAGEYAHTLLALPAMQEWIAAGTERESLPHYEPA